MRIDSGPSVTIFLRVYNLAVFSTIFTMAELCEFHTWGCRGKRAMIVVLLPSREELVYTCRFDNAVTVSPWEDHSLIFFPNSEVTIFLLGLRPMLSLTDSRVHHYFWYSVNFTLIFRPTNVWSNYCKIPSILHQVYFRTWQVQLLAEFNRINRAFRWRWADATDGPRLLSWSVSGTFCTNDLPSLKDDGYDEVVTFRLTFVNSVNEIGRLLWDVSSVEVKRLTKCLRSASWKMNSMSHFL